MYIPSSSSVSISSDSRSSSSSLDDHVYLSDDSYIELSIEISDTSTVSPTPPLPLSTCLSDVEKAQIEREAARLKRLGLRVISHLSCFPCVHAYVC